MNILVNGKEITVEEKTTISQLLQQLNIENKVMATAVNMEIIKENKWKEFKLKDGDKIEFLHFVGGG